jgi:uncharacterized membrane protein YeiB
MSQRGQAPSSDDHPAVTRVHGIDAARAAAIVGMVMVHFGPDRPRAGLARLYGLPGGRASILFVVLAGVGVSLLAADRSTERRRAVWTRLTLRAAVLLPAGLALQLLDHGVLVILQHYALLFLVAASAVALSDRGLLVGGFIVLGVAPLLYIGAWHLWPDWFTGQPAVITDPPVIIVRDLLLTGGYPVLTWTAPLLFGMWLGRQDLARGGLRLVFVGSLIAVAVWVTSRALVAWLGLPKTEPSWLQLVLDAPHSQMPLWLLGSVASAIAVLGLTFVAVDRWPRLTWPLVAMGQLALTVYVAQLLALTLWPRLLRSGDVLGATMSVIRFTIVAAVVAVLWRSRFARGPLEAALRLPRSLRRHDTSPGTRRERLDQRAPPD